MPTNIYDLTYVFFASVTVFLMLALCAILWHWAKQVCSKMDIMNNSIAGLKTAEKVNETNITNHVENRAIHCKGGDCIMARNT